MINFFSIESRKYFKNNSTFIKNDNDMYPQ